MLRSDVETGISGDDHEFAQRRDAFGSNTYPVKKGRTFWVNFCVDCYFGVTIHLVELKLFIPIQTCHLASLHFISCRCSFGRPGRIRLSLF